MLAKFITRPDIKKLHMPAFIDWLLTRMKTADRTYMPFRA